MFKKLVQSMDERSRAVLYALKLYAENALLVGVICDLNGKPVSVSDLVPLKYVDEAIEHNVIYAIGEFYVFASWHEYFSRELSSADVERFRKANGYSRKDYVDFLEKYIGNADRYKNLIDCYRVVSKKPKGVSEILDGCTLSDEERKLVCDYAIKFGTRSQYDKGVIPLTLNVSEAITEIVAMYETGTVYYSGKKHSISREKLTSSLKRVISMQHVIHLKNNNYLKQPLINQENKVPTETNIAKTREGY